MSSARTIRSTAGEAATVSVQPAAAPKAPLQRDVAVLPATLVQNKQTLADPMEGYELENEIRLAKEEILKLKSDKATERVQHATKWKELQDEKDKMKCEHEKFKKEEKARYNSLLKEKEKCVEEMIKQNKENELKVAKLQTDMEKVRMELALKSFRFESTESSNEEDPVIENNIDECIISVKCAGNCDHISCRMQVMRLQGGRRTTPADKPETFHTCNQCGITATTKNELKKTHGNCAHKASHLPLLSGQLSKSECVEKSH